MKNIICKLVLGVAISAFVVGMTGCSQETADSGPAPKNAAQGNPAASEPGPTPNVAGGGGGSGPDAAATTK